mmetsp:Transcript_78100/g.252815  ORF Transcript_78100/g.252815 Transcript_78100/m.252815 type:complete len:1548 (+) Transcript_78100:58-4701(+)
MGKKASAKKRGRALDQRGYATVSVASIKKEADKNVEEGADAVEEAQPVGEPAEVEGPADRTGTDAQHEEECEDWERLGEDTSPRAEADAAKTEPPPEAPAEGAAAFDEEWEKAVESRLDDELQKLERRFIPTDATAQLERRGGAAPAGVVVLSKAAEQQLEAALTPLRDEEGLVKMTFPRHWRYKGKLTYERLNGIYLALESLNFKGEQIRWAMENTLGYDMRSALELLLVNIRKDNLPRQFGGEGTGDTMDATQNGTCDGGNGPHKSANSKAEPEPGNQAFVPPSTAEAPSAAEAAAQAPLPVDPQPQPCARSPDECGAPPEQGKAGPPQTEERGADFMKKWMTQYCQASDSDSDELLDPEERLERERRQDPTARFLKISRQFDELMKVCKALKEKKKHGSFKQNISSDMQRQKEANARMSAIKIELEHLERGKYGKLDRSRIDRELAARQKNTPATAPVPAEKSEGSVEKAVAGGSAGKHDQGPSDDTPADEDPTELPSLFDAEVSGELLGEQPPTAADSQPPCRAYNIAGWSGRTPKQNLEEFVRKRIWGKQSPANGVATYQRVQVPGGNRHTARVGVHLPRGQGTRHFDPQEACESIRDAEHLAATFALMKLSEDADRPGLCRGLPPAFKQRWQEWEQEAASRLREARRELARNRIVFLERMLRTKPSVALLGSVGNNADAPAGRMWADPSEGEQFVELSGDAASKLRASFAQRQEALKDDPAFAQIQQVRSSLPVADYRESFVRLVKGSGVVVVSGATGSGKTTQVPQFVLEDALAQGGDGAALPNIIVTEPRRISAVSVAKRVSQELGDPPGGPGARSSLVGYHIRLERRVSESTRLLFCTVGVLLKQMQQGLGALSRVTHVFLDEVHERSADTDFLLTFLRDISATRPNLRVVLMSATLDTKSFVRYFSVLRGGKVVEPPTIHIKGFMFPVAEVYLETIAMKCGYHRALEARKPGEVWSAGQRHEDIDCQLLAQLVDNIYWSEHGPWDFVTDRQVREDNKGKWTTAQGGAESKGAVLVFLPGVGEINELVAALRMQRSAGRLWVLPLHAGLPPDEQQLCFETTLPQGYDVKVICATNIAETSVTVPDVVVVIDSCRHRLNMMEKGSNVATLRMQWCAQDSLRQRRGRAGRVQPGVAFRLILSEDMEKLEETTPPEMTRTPLENLYLQSCASGIADVPGFLLRTPDPPTRLAIQFAETCLQDLGALDDSAPDKLSPLGRHLGAIPTHPRISKMLVIGCLLGCPHEALSIGGFLAARNPLITAPDARRGEWHAAREELVRAVGFVSDHLVWALLLSDWEQLNIGQRRQTAQRYGLVFERMNEALRERQLLAESLVALGFLPKDFLAERMDSRARAKWPLVVAAVVGGMYPNVLSAERAGERCLSSDPAERAIRMRYQVLQRHHSKQDAMCYPKPMHVHSNSICFGADQYHCPYMAFFTSQQTMKLYAYDATEVTPWSVVLMSSDQPVFEETESTSCIIVGGWARFQCTDPSIMKLILALRSSWNRVLGKKLADVRWDHTESRELAVLKRLLLDQGLGWELSR